MMDWVDMLWNTLSLVVAFIVLQQMFRFFGHDGLPIRRWLVPYQISMQQNKETQTGIGTGSILRREVEFGEADNPTRIVLIGKTGTGKSSTGNTVLGKTTGNGGFKVETGMKAVTVDCERKMIEVNGEKLMVIDTPGLCYTIRSVKELQHTITKCLFMCRKGPHALLFVVKATERFTREEYNAYYSLKQMFGGNVAEYIICVFTQGDQLNGKRIEDVLEEFGRDIDQQKRICPDRQQKFADIRDILKDISDRYVVISNKGDDATKDALVRVLLEKIHDLKNRNEASPVFTNLKTRRLWLLLESEVLRYMEEENLNERQAFARFEHRLCGHEGNDSMIREAIRMVDNGKNCIVM